MGARKKLNSASLLGSLLLAGIAGLATGSFTVFVVAAVVIVVLSIHAGDIRLRRRRGRRKQ